MATAGAEVLFNATFACELGTLPPDQARNLFEDANNRLHGLLPKLPTRMLDRFRRRAKEAEPVPEGDAGETNAIDPGLLAVHDLVMEARELNAEIARLAWVGSATLARSFSLAERAQILGVLLDNQARAAQETVELADRARQLLLDDGSFRRTAVERYIERAFGRVDWPTWDPTASPALFTRSVRQFDQVLTPR